MISDDIKNKKMRPAELLGVLPPAGQNLENCFFQPAIKDTSPAIQSMISEAWKYMEVLAGAGPALSGGGITNNRTGRAYAQARDQNLGRLAMPFQNAKNLLARIQEKMVNEFVSKRPRGEVFAVIGKQGRDWEQRVIDLTQAKGGKVIAYAEDSETIPTTHAQKKSLIENMEQSNNPMIQAILAEPNNAQLIFDIKGIPEMVIPGKAEREKMLRRIDQLMQAAPAPGAGTGNTCAI